jgi:hypothetical protein
MLRTVVYSGPAQPRRKSLRPKKNDNAAQSDAEQAPKDGYLEKLVKYVPVEVLAVFVPLAAAAKDNDTLAWIVFGVGFVATIGYLAYHADTLPSDKRPKPYFYALAAVAFGFWAAGASDTTRALIGISATVTEVSLGIAVLLLPLADWVLGKIFRTDS